jgi:molybdenum cofactor synthesis domain-containing protein
MKVEIVSISNQLLMSDILDTNAAHVSRSLSQLKVSLTCKVTVGDDLDLITDVIQNALARADIVITIGGLGSAKQDFTRQAVARALGRDYTADFGVAGAAILGNKDAYMPGLLVHDEQGTLFCLPANRNEMSFLLETEVFPYLQDYALLPPKSNWLLLRTVGQAASSLKEMLTGIAQEPDEKVTFDTFAGQANVRLWAQAPTEAELAERLARLKQEALLRLGDHVYGEGEVRLESAILDALHQHQRRLVLAECNTNQILANTWQRLLPEGDDTITAVATDTPAELANYLQIEPYQPDDDLTQWCRTVAEILLAQTNSDLSLLVYKNILPGGVQILVTLASPQGASVTNRSFGGHPDYIDEWSITLGLTHLRRWLLVHH